MLYESMVVMYLMTMLPPAPKIELDDDKLKVENKRRVYGHALVPSFEGLVLFKEQLASSKHALRGIQSQEKAAVHTFVRELLTAT